MLAKNINDISAQIKMISLMLPLTAVLIISTKDRL